MEVKEGLVFYCLHAFLHMTVKGGLVITCKTMRITIEQVLEQVYRTIFISYDPILLLLPIALIHLSKTSIYNPITCIHKSKIL